MRRAREYMRNQRKEDEAKKRQKAAASAPEVPVAQPVPVEPPTVDDEAREASQPEQGDGTEAVPTTGEWPESEATQEEDDSSQQEKKRRGRPRGENHFHSFLPFSTDSVYLFLILERNLFISFT